jgi:hypothetical protein
MIDGGPGSLAPGKIDGWLVTDDKCELITKIRAEARLLNITPSVSSFVCPRFRIDPLPVLHTSHPTFGYLLRARGISVVWAPEFLEFPDWANDASLMFAEAAGWSRPIRFAGGVGGHCPVLDVVHEARTRGVRRLVLAHIGRPTLRAIDANEPLPFGEFGVEGRTYRVRPRPKHRKRQLSRKK